MPRCWNIQELQPSQVIARDRHDQATIAVPSSSICIVTGPGGSATNTHTDTDMLVLRAGGPYRLEVQASDGRAWDLEDILVGDIWALAGQSNMAGAGELDPPPEPVEQARMLSFDGRWRAAQDPLHRLWADGDTVVSRAARRFFHPTLSDEEWSALLARSDEIASPQVGPGASFAREMSAATGVPIGLLPCALGSTSLGSWMPDADASVDRDETLYGNLVARANRHGPLRGVLWHQGEGDTGPGLGHTYEERFTSFVEHLRRDVGNDQLPIVAAQIARYDLEQLLAVHGIEVDPQDVPGWSAVRDAMRRVGDRVANVSIVATADLALGDGIHLDRGSQEKLGQRFALVAAGYVTDAPPRSSPRLASVVATGASVRCGFTDVAEGLELTGPCDFAVEPGGCALSVKVSGRDSIELTVDAAPPPGATLTYGPGLNPRAGLIDGALAVPLFGPIPIS